MNEEQQKEVATFRFGVIHDLAGGAMLQSGEKERLIREKCARKWSIPFSNRTRIGRSTIIRWAKAYQDAGGKLEALYPGARSDRGRSRSLSDETEAALIGLRKKNPLAPVREIINEMRSRGLAGPDVELNPSTVYRFFHAYGLMKATTPIPEDRRKFEAELPNDLWQSDCMHGPMVLSEGKQRKTYLLAFIDDHSRLVPHGAFYPTEGTASFLAALEMAFSTRGLPRRLYTDNGSAFRSKHLEQVCASLGVALIHARPYKPQGKGKIERFFRTVRGDFLPGFRGRTLDELNEAFDLWLRHVYHQRVHGGTGQTPLARFTARMECLRPAPRDLLDHFRQTVKRKVAKDRTISLNGRIFEAPVELIGKQVDVLYHDHEPELVEVRLNHKSYGRLRPVDLHVNARVKRDKNHNIAMDEDNGASRYRGGELWGRKEE
ncbi:MAG: IS481 family transposase [Pseudomonadota bacterium]